ncbi:MAG TPA: amino acid ABC transporter permease [Candidatus Dormibacteraeota bacterium]
MSEITSGQRPAAAAVRPEAIKAIPVRHPWRWISAAVIFLLAADLVYMVVQSIAVDKTSDGYGWAAIWHYLFSYLILRGVLITIELTVVAMVLGVVLGVILAVMRLSPNPVTSSIAWLYIWFFRGTPVIVQIFFWFNLNSVLHVIGLGFPGTPYFVLFGHTNSLIPAFLSVALGLGLNEAAYMAEIVRAGIISVEQGQTEAAQALGMTRLLVMRRIVLPQAMRVIIPPTGNETISMLKTTSLAVVVGSVPDLFTIAHQISETNFAIVELAVVASLWYLFMTTILTIGQYYIERYFARGSQRELPPTPLQRFRRTLFTFHAPPPGPVEVPVSLGHERR